MDIEIYIDGLRRICKGCDATYTIHRHHRNVINVTGVKSNSHINLCMQYIQDVLNVKVEESIIDNQFFSYKGNKVLDLKKSMKN